jgi:hypothetical protein
MSARNKIESKSLRRRERREHVPQICLSGPNSATSTTARKLKTMPLAKVFQIFKRSVRRLRRTEQLIAKLPPNKISTLLTRVVAHCKWLGGLALQELDRREKTVNRPAAAK